MKSCWKCNREIPADSISCPYCTAPASQQAVNEMATVGPGAAPVNQIVSGVEVNNRYTVKKEIGRGGMGIVYLAYDKMLEKQVALKVIPQELCMDPKAVADLKREAAIAMELTHENIVRLYNLDTWQGQAFVVMEYVGAGTMSHILAEGQLTLEKALPYIRQVARALDFSHSNNPSIIHRDLKPLNLLISENGATKVADFGLARVIRDSATRISGHDSAGTLAYMAPEQLRGKGIGKATDIYAFAAIVYEMLAGNAPFHTGDLRWQIMHEEVEPIAEQPDYVNTALQAALSKEREDRPQTAGDFVAMLEGKISSKGGRKQKQSKSRQKAQKNSSTFSSKTLLLGGCLILLLASLGGGLTYWKKQPVEVVSEVLLEIVSKPQGAEIYLDGALAGQTPFEITELADGSHDLKLVKDGFNNHTARITTRKGVKQKISAILVQDIEQAVYGFARISSQPEGAEIFFNNKKVGVTPVEFDGLVTGRYSLKLKKDGYKMYESQVEINSGAAAIVNADLVLLPPVKKMSAPMIAEKKKETVVKPETAAHKINKSEPQVEQPKEKEEKQQMEEAKYGWLLVSTLPKDAVVKILNIGPKYSDGMKLNPGRYNIQVTREGYKKKTQWISVKNDEFKTLKIELDKEPGINWSKTSLSSSSSENEPKTVVDNATRLMWTAVDNKADLDWQRAKNYCDRLRYGGYSNWRMPTSRELEKLFSGSASRKIRLSVDATNLWASDEKRVKAKRYDTKRKKVFWSYKENSIHFRVIAVRRAR